MRGGNPKTSMLRHVVDMFGRRFGRLVCLSPIGKQGNEVLWICRCDCGKTIILNSKMLKPSGTKSCGCLRWENHRKKVQKHGLYKSAEFKIWIGMIQRCHNANNPSFFKYGGRGIFVCEIWRESFANFISDMGRRPHGTSLDRIDNDKGYYPENCRWTDLSTQARNSRKIPSLCRSRFKGVYIMRNGNWQAQIVFKGKNHTLGTFKSETEAAETYDKAAKYFLGDKAVTNADLGRF